MAIKLGSTDVALRAGNRPVLSASSFAPAIPLLIATGESNSGGYALNSDATADELAPRPAVQILNNDTLLFEDLDVGTNNLLGHSQLEEFSETRHGIELEFANQVSSGLWPSSTAYLCKTGQGGSEASGWTVRTGTNMTIFSTRVSAAMSLLDAAGIAYRPVIFMTIGINDGIEETAEETFRANMRTYIENVRFVAGATTPIFIPLFQSLDAPDYINESLTAVAAEHDDVYVFNTDGFAQTDSYHWSYAGFKSLATAFKSEVLSRQARLLLAPRTAYGFHPRHIRGLRLWLDASDESTITNEDGVSSWGDKSGRGLSFTQATPESRPATGTASINGLNVLAFDGSNDSLENASQALPPTSPMTLFIVQRIVSATNAGMTYTSGSGATFDVRQSSTTGKMSFIGTANGVGWTEPNAATGANRIYSMVFNTTGTNNAFYTNGVADALGAAPQVQAALMATQYIGRRSDGFYANIWLAEVLCYNRILDATERAAAEKYLSDKWGVALA
jgi:hypothetical protein